MPPESASRPIYATMQKNSTTNMGHSTIHIGQKVNIRSRIRWVRLPSDSTAKKQGSSEGTIDWWPGVLYKDHGELMCDVRPTDAKFQARCLIEHLKYRDTETSPAVVYIMGYMPNMIRTVYEIDKSNSEHFGFDTQGIDGPNLKSFYHHFDIMNHNGMSSSANVSQSQIDMFTNAVTTVLAALAAEADASPDRIFQKR